MRYLPPLKVKTIRLYLINRGWTNDDASFPFTAPEGKQHVEGIISPFEKYGLNLSNTEGQQSLSRLLLQELTYSLASDLLGRRGKY